MASPICKLIFSCLLFGILSLSGIAQAEVKLAAVFGDNMVLQVGREIAFFGSATPGERVSITLRNDIIASTRTNENGRWLIKMNPLQPGDPFEVVVEGDDNKITLKNVVMGEVWICSGQSNMEWTVAGAGNPAEEIANANYPMIRHVDINNKFSPQKQVECESSGWTVCSPQTAGNYTAVGYYFARKLHEETKLPVGLINSTWGGTIVEAWTSGKSLKTHPDFKERVEQIEAQSANLEAEARKFQNESKIWNTLFADATQKTFVPWNGKTLSDTKGWAKLQPGKTWEAQSQKSLDGVGWYRKTVTLPANLRGKKLTLSLGTIDDFDQTWVNGQSVGMTAGWNKRRVYEVPAHLTNGNELSIAVRVVDSSGGGGLVGRPNDYYVAAGETKVALNKDWDFRFSPATLDLPSRPKRPGFNGPNNPTGLYNSMIHPILATSFRGVIWYQGESNAGRPKQYRSLFPLLINDWRERHSELRGEIHRYEFPFYWVQLANFMRPADQPAPSNWALLREAQSMTLSLENTGQAVIIDIGDARDIHPKNKQDVGKRLALMALKDVHDFKIQSRSPMYRGMKREGNKIRIEFDHADGLMAKGGALKRFEIAGADKKFVWADAIVDGETVLVSSLYVPEPRHVRYAWADNPEGCNLYNGVGLPASPFRTDKD